MSHTPKVSVCMITFNHAEFISKALDSVLAQRTSFDYELVIGDDGSTDGTADVIRGYQARWPQKVKPLFRERNVGMGKNFSQTLESCQGEYVALLEGDDYWTDSNKLQYQADYLDQNEGCALCHHTVQHIAWPGEQTLKEYPPKPYRQERPPPRQLAMFNFVQTCSVMFRRKWMPPLDEQFQELKLGDWPLFVLLNQKGWIGYIDQTMAHYRVHLNNTWNNRGSDYKIKAMETMAWYLLKHVNPGSQDEWEDTLLALAFKDLLLAAGSFALRNSMVKLGRFMERSLEFKKPLWLFTRLPQYYAAHRS